MKSRLGVVGAVLVVTIALVAGAVRADGHGKDWNVTIGGGGAIQPEYDGADDYQATAFPQVDIRWRDTVFLSLDQGLGWNAYRGRNLRVGPVATYYWGNDDRPTGINDVDAGFQVGAFAEFAFDHWRFDAVALQAVSGDSDGSRFNLGVAYGSRIEKDWRVVLRGDTTWYSENEMKTYFGISAQESSASGLAQSNPGSGFKDVGLGLSVVYAISKNWSVQARSRISYLLGDAADSPLVDVVGSEFQGVFGLGGAYHF